MKKLVVVMSVIFITLCEVYSKPMETLQKYNVVLVHGAADSSGGFEELCSGILEPRIQQMKKMILAGISVVLQECWVDIDKINTIN